MKWTFGMVGRVVRAPAFHRCGPGSSPGSGNRIICELSLFDVLFSTMPRGFFLRVLRFFLPQQKSTCELSDVCKIFNVEVVSVSASRRIATTWICCRGLLLLPSFALFAWWSRATSYLQFPTNTFSRDVKDKIKNKFFWPMSQSAKVYHFSYQQVAFFL